MGVSLIDHNFFLVDRYLGRSAYQNDRLVARNLLVIFSRRYFQLSKKFASKYRSNDPLQLGATHRVEFNIEWPAPCELYAPGPTCKNFCPKCFKNARIFCKISLKQHLFVVPEVTKAESSSPTKTPFSVHAYLSCAFFGIRRGQ